MHTVIYQYVELDLFYRMTTILAVCPSLHHQWLICVTVWTGHTLAWPMAGSYTLTDREKTGRRICHRKDMSFMLMSRVRGQKHQSKYSIQNILIEKQQTHQYLACHHVNSRWYHYCQVQSLSQQKYHLHTHDKCSLVVNNHTVTSQIIFTDSWMQKI